MRPKLSKVQVISILSLFLITSFINPALASDNAYSIRISCIIPAIPGQNMPLVKEQKVQAINKQESSPVMFQKETKEIRVRAEKKETVEVKTFYQR